MRETNGNMWSYLDRKKFVLFIPTNGFIKKDGTGVMGAGVAFQAAEQFPELPRLLGMSLQKRNNVVSLLLDKPNLIYSFPVKHAWYEKADKKLIKASVVQLLALARKHPERRFILPRPGCGNGKLKYEGIRPLLEVLPDNVFVITNEHNRIS